MTYIHGIERKIDVLKIVEDGHFNDGLLHASRETMESLLRANNVHQPMMMSTNVSVPQQESIGRAKTRKREASLALGVLLASFWACSSLCGNETALSGI